MSKRAIGKYDMSCTKKISPNLHKNGGFKWKTVDMQNTYQPGEPIKPCKSISKKFANFVNNIYDNNLVENEFYNLDADMLLPTKRSTTVHLIRYVASGELRASLEIGELTTRKWVHVKKVVKEAQRINGINTENMDVLYRYYLKSFLR